MTQDTTRTDLQAGEVNGTSIGSAAASALLHPIVKCISLLNFGYAVHPTEPIHLPDSEFITVQDGYKIRIIHLPLEDSGKVENNFQKPFQGINDDLTQINKAHQLNKLNKVESSVRKSLDKRLSVRNSLTEEYWFTRWNRPLHAGNPGNRCSCSFRRSQRYSKLESVLQQELKTNKKTADTVSESPPTKITNLETFIERLLQETCLEAYQEVFITQNKSKHQSISQTGDELIEDKTEKATDEHVRISKDSKIDKKNKLKDSYDNLGYVQGPDEVDTVVVKRRKDSKPITAESNENNLCRHNLPKTNKPFIFLLHGLASTADVWWNIIASLAPRGYEIAAPDMLGHGYSSAPDKQSAYRFKKLLEHALAAFDHYALNDESRKFIVIGHSFGCSLATAIARYRSQQVVQLVLISGGGPTALSPPEIGNEISVFSNLQVLISPLLFCGIKRSLFYATRGKHFLRCDSDESIPKYVLDYIDREQHWPEGDAAFHRRILIPTLLVHGLKDTNVTLVQECEMERTIPRAFLELIPTAGHMSMLETPEQLSHMILCFIEWWAR